MVSNDSIDLGPASLRDEPSRVGTCDDTTKVLWVQSIQARRKASALETAWKQSCVPYLDKTEDTELKQRDAYDTWQRAKECWEETKLNDEAHIAAHEDEESPDFTVCTAKYFSRDCVC